MTRSCSWTNPARRSVRIDAMFLADVTPRILFGRKLVNTQREAARIASVASPSRWYRAAMEKPISTSLSRGLNPR